MSLLTETILNILAFNFIKSIKYRKSGENIGLANLNISLKRLGLQVSILDTSVV